MLKTLTVADMGTVRLRYGLKMPRSPARRDERRPFVHSPHSAVVNHCNRLIGWL